MNLCADVDSAVCMDLRMDLRADVISAARMDLCADVVRAACMDLRMDLLADVYIEVYVDVNVVRSAYVYAILVLVPVSAICISRYELPSNP